MKHTAQWIINAFFLSPLFLMTSLIVFVQEGYADTYKKAMKQAQTQTRPFFVDEQIQLTRQQPAKLTQAVTFPETLKYIQNYRQSHDRRLDDIVREYDPRLLSDAARSIQNQALQDQVDPFLTQRIELLPVLNIAFARNPAIRSASEAWQASLNRYPQAAFLDGILRQYNTFTKTLNLLLSGMQPQRQMIDAEFPFPSVTSLRGDIIKTDVAIAEMDFSIALRDTLTEVKKAYYDYVYIDRAILISKDNQELLEQMLQVASRKFEAGETSYNNVLKARISLSELTDDILTLEDQRSTIQVKLNTLLDRSPYAPLGKAPYIEVRVPQIALNELYQIARESRQEIRKTRYLETRTQQMIALAEEMNRPDPTFGASYFQDRSALLVGSEPPRPAFNPLPKQPLRPWFGQREAFIEEMRDRQDDLLEKIKNVVNNTEYQVKSSHFLLDAALRERALYQSTLIIEARQSLEVAEKDYEGARIDFLDYLDAQRTWLDFNLTLYKAQRDVGTAFANLERAVGISLENNE